MNRLKTIDWRMMAVALAGSFIIWLIVTSVTDPTIKKPYEVPVEYINEDLLVASGKSAEILEETVSIQVKAPRSVISTLRVTDFKAVADFSEMYQDNLIPVKVSVPNGNAGTSVIDLLDSSVEVRLQDIISVSLPIEYVLEGTPAEGHAVGDVSILPDKVTVTAPEAFALTVNKALVELDVEDVKETFYSSQKLTLYDAEGEALDLTAQKDASMDCSEMVTCNVQILTVQSMPITIRFSEDAKVDPGYRITNQSVLPNEVVICGEKSRISAMMGIEITDLPISGATESIQKQLDIRTYLPEGVDIYQGSNLVNVTVEIQPLVERTFRIASEKIKVEDVPDNCGYRFMDSEVEVVLRGIAPELDKLTEFNGQMSVSMKGMTAGLHEIPVAITLPSEEFEQVGTASVTVQIYAIADGAALTE